MKKISQYIFGFILFAIVMIMSPIYAQAGQAQNDYNAYSGEGITFKNGEVIVVSAGGKAKTGYKYRSIGWNINVKKDGVDHNIYVADSEGSRYEETVGSTVYTSVHFSESLISEKSGVSLRTGSITMIANARMEAYRASDNKIYSTNNSWTEWCAHADWANKAIREALERYTDGSKTRQYKDTYYNKVIRWSSYYFDVKPGTGVSKTTGSGWYSAWSTASYGGTAKTGYHGTKSGTKTITRNDSVTVTADPNILTINFNGNGGTNVPNTQTWAYDSYYGLPSTTPVKAGYTWKGWSTKSAWDSNASKWGTGGWYSAQAWASAFGKDLGSDNQSVTLYAQWERTITYTFGYWNGTRGDARTSSVTFHNGDTIQTMTIPTEALNNKTRNDKVWTFDGFDYWDGYRSTGACDISASTTTINISPSDYNKTLYAKYHGNVTITYIDYGTDKQEKRSDTKIAYMNWSYSSHYDPEFIIPNENTMKYTEATAKCKHNYNSSNGDSNSNSSYTRCSLCKQEEWPNKNGWTFDANNRTGKDLDQGAKYSSHGNNDKTLYGLYSKYVKLIYNYNGSTGNKNYDSYTRYVNASNVANATTQSFTLPLLTYRQNGVTKYSLGGWTGVKVSPNNDFNISSLGTYTNIVGENVGNEKEADFKYTPRVNETIYAAWTNQTAQTAIEPKVNVVKSVEWKNPSSDNSSVDYDGLQNIDIDGNAVVTLDITVSNTNGYKVDEFKVDDYINTDMWTYKYDARDILGGVNYINYKNGSIHIELPSTNSSATYRVTYEIQLKEPYWNVTEDTKLYTNKIPDVTKYLNSLTNKDAYSKYDSTKNYNSVTGIVNYSNMYYCENQAAEQSYVKATYHIKNGRVRGTERQVHYATPYVVMRQVNWIPKISLDQGIGIESDTNNIYHNIDSSYNNTYFVRYDTKGANSTFRLYELSQLKRSYTTYQITNNLMDMKSVNKTQEVIDNALGISSMRSDTWSNTTSSKLSSGFKALDLLKVSKADNIRGSVTTNGFIYPYGALTTYDTDYATNQDGLKFSLYPFVRTTNSKTGKTYETTRDTSKLANKRLDLTIDATDPIITADSNIKTKSDTYGQWTEKAGRRSLLL